MPKAIVHGNIKGGRFIADFPSVFRDATNQFESKRVTISIGLFKRPRSLRQNRFLQGVVYPMIATASEHTQEEIADYCKKKFLPPRFVLDEALMGTTTKLGTVEFEEYVERIRVWALDFWGITVPTPNQVEN